MDSTGHSRSSRRQDPPHLFGGRKRHHEAPRSVPKRSRIIRREELELAPERLLVVGGDPTTSITHDAPAIVIEQDHGRITRILVTCPCGRHAELIANDES